MIGVVVCVQRVVHRCFFRDFFFAPLPLIALPLVALPLAEVPWLRPAPRLPAALVLLAPLVDFLDVLPRLPPGLEPLAPFAVFFLEVFERCPPVPDSFVDLPNRRLPVDAAAFFWPGRFLRPFSFWGPPSSPMTVPRERRGVPPSRPTSSAESIVNSSGLNFAGGPLLWEVRLGGLVFEVRRGLLRLPVGFVPPVRRRRSELVPGRRPLGAGLASTSLAALRNALTSGAVNGRYAPAGI